MKKALLVSLVFHAAFIISALILLQSEEAKKGLPPFYANIITPDEYKRLIAPEKQAPPPVQPPKKQLPTPSKPAVKTPKSPADTAIQQSIPSRRGNSQNTAGFSPSESKQSPTVPLEMGTGITGSRAKSSKAPQITPKEQLFDKDIISRFSEQDGSSKKNDSITFDTKEYRYFGYMRRLKEKIEGIWNYPTEAAERGIYGDLHIRFTIKKDGRLGAVELVRTSGHKSLDDAAIRALRDAEPFWPLPSEWNREGFTIEGHFIYSLQGIYIR